MLRQVVAPQSTVSVGTVLSMPIVSVAPVGRRCRRCRRRGSRACAGPRSVIETPGVVTTEPPSTLYSTRATPEPGLASVPVTVVVKFVLRHGAVGAGVVLTGLVRSTRTVSERQAEALPALSTIRVSSVCDALGRRPRWRAGLDRAAVHAPLGVVDAGRRRRCRSARSDSARRLPGRRRGGARVGGQRRCRPERRRSSSPTTGRRCRARGG